MDLGKRRLRADEVLISCSHGELVAVMLPGQRCALCEAAVRRRQPQNTPQERRG